MNTVCGQDTADHTAGNCPHTAALAALPHKADRILYGCDRLPRPTTGEVRAWLDAHDVPTTRQYASTTVSAWRRERGLSDTGDLIPLTPERIAELDALTAAPDTTGDTTATSQDASAGVRYRPRDVPDTTSDVLDIPSDTPPTSDGVSDDRRTRPRDASADSNRAVQAVRWLATARDAIDDTRIRRPTPVATGTEGRAWAWAAFGLGAGFSVVANVVHTLHPTTQFLADWVAANPGRTAAEWHPGPVAVAFGAFWPVAVLLAVELLTRVRWQPGFWFGAVRYGGTLACALVAAVVSYQHMANLFTAWGQPGVTAHLGPLAVDGLMLVAAAALLSIARGRVPTTRPRQVGDASTPS